MPAERFSTITEYIMGEDYPGVESSVNYANSNAINNFLLSSGTAGPSAYGNLSAIEDAVATKGAGGGTAGGSTLGSFLNNFQRTAMREQRGTQPFNVNDAFRNRPIEGYFLKPEARQAILENRLTSGDSSTIRKGIGIAPPLPPGSGGPV